MSYVDANDDYVNGNRTRDRYILQRENVTGQNAATTCRGTATCEAQYDYDARDRLIRHQQRAGKVSTYRFDEEAFLLGDTTIRAGNLTTEVSGGQSTTRRYTSSQLTDLAVAGTTVAEYWYRPTGDLDCVTIPAGSQTNCSPPAGAPAANLIADYTYDYLQRLTGTDMYSGVARTDNTRYTYDPLDRVSTEVEDHAGTGNDRTTEFTYQGLTGLVTEEKQTGSATNLRTKTFSYDAYGHRITMNDRPTGTAPDGPEDAPYSYGYDVHGSVSQLIDRAGNVKASYGYTAYGGVDATDTESLTTGDTNNQAPVNPYRYSGKRMDSGTVPSSTPAGPAGAGGYDMGARRYGPDITSFLQQDMFASAIGDLGLGLDPLTQNRYALAGGNPISYVETDGHMAIANGGGGGGSTESSDGGDGGGGSTCADEYGYVYACSQGIGAVGGTPATQSGAPPVDRDRAHAYCSSMAGGLQYNSCMASLGDPVNKQTVSGTPWDPDYEPGSPVREGAGDFLWEMTGIPDAKRCFEGTVSGCAWTVVGFTPVRVLKLGKLAKHADEADVAAKACSFTGETGVLMADGTRKPISKIKVGDKVRATDPETGETSAKTVTAVWVHEDSVIALDIDGKRVTTTEDHPFWNDTDQQWQRADQFDPGDRVRAADGRTVPVNGLRLVTRHHATAYNLTVDDIHTYYVIAGDTPVLVHNECRKPVNLPAWRKVNIDIGHIIDHHTAGGKVYQQSGIKDKFPDYMSQGEIESTVRQAYRYSTMAGPSQVDRVFLRGSANGLEIEM